MKFDAQKAFPYPVLRPYSDDYMDIDFQTMVEFVVGKEKLTARLAYAISSEEIVAQIEKGNAEYVSVVSCRDTYFRRALATREVETEHDFDIGQMRGEVTVDPYVVVRKPIKKFTSPDINPEFGAGPFQFHPGDVLAQDEPQVFYLDRDLFRPVTSVFELVRREELSGGEWVISYDQDHIQIGLGATMKASIDDARNSKTNRAILLNSIYFSAVMQSIEKLRTAEGEYEDYKWAQVIRRQAHNQGLDLTAHDAYLSAERLMRYPLGLLEAFVFRGADE